jgi:hypothetical protein
VGEFPAGLHPDDLGVVVAFSDAGEFTAEVVSDKKIVEIYPVLSREILDAGYEIVSGDNEGFEAEIFFRKGTKKFGAYRLKEEECPGRVAMRLTFGDQQFEQ